MSSQSTRANWILFLLLGFLWGSSYLFIKIGVENGLPPFTLVAGRLAIGAALLAGVLVISRETLPRDRGTYGRLFVMSILNIVVPFSLITFGEQSIDSALASILNGTVPLFTIVLASMFLPDESITVNRVVGLAVGFAGVFILVSRSLGGSAPADQTLGEILLIASAVSYALGNVYAKRSIKGLRPPVVSFFQVFLALITVVVLAFIFERPLDVRPNTDAILAVIWLGLLGSGFAYLIFFRLLRDWGSTRSSLVAYLLPVVGIILGTIVRQEGIDGRLIFGTALVIGGIALVNSRYGRRKLYGRVESVPDTAGP